jgi:3-deoxy-D-manno-octulosonic-acid transferase
MNELKERGRSCKLIAVPRHLSEAGALAAELGDGCLRTPDTTISAAWDICCIEKLGVLESLYRIADAAVVGGTFVDIGGHNVWEAAQYGIPVFFGPYYHEQRSGCEKLLGAGAGFMVKSAKALADGLEKTLWTQRESFAAARSLLTEASNGRQTILESLIP